MSDNQLPHDTAQELVRDLIKEKRSERRWRNIRFFLGLFLVLYVIYLIMSGTKSPMLPMEGGYISYLRLDGMIGPDGDFSSEVVVPELKEAFSDSLSKGVLLDINSGGGTPVQAAIIHDAIVALKKKYHKKVIVVGEDMLASGAYYIAVAADKIYVNPNTITGSIGAVMKGFGFTEMIKKIGVERRVYASGANKDRLDPFLPQTKEDVEKIQQVINEVHNNFNQIVLQGRQGKLHADQSVLFSGDFWSGSTALKLGLVDGLGNLMDVMHNEFQVTHYKNYGQSGNFLKSIAGQFGMAMGTALTQHALFALQ